MNSRKLSILVLLVFPLLSATDLNAGNPIGLVPQTVPPMERQGRPMVWKGPVINYWPDRGALGMLPNKTARNLVEQMFRVWDVESDVIGFQERDDINMDIDGRNYLDYVNKRDGISPVIFDNNREIMKALGLPKELLALSGPEFLDPKTGYISESILIINTDPWDGEKNDEAGELSDTYLQALLVHSIGHFIGLGHSQVNGEAFENQRPIQGFGIPPEDLVETMYPLLLPSQKTLQTDDIVTLNWLYPGAAYLNKFATIKGTVKEWNSSTGAQGVNIVARNMDAYDRLAVFRDAVSQVSGILYDPDIPQSAPARGTYELPGLTPFAPYRVEVEPLGRWFQDDLTVRRDTPLRSNMVPMPASKVIREFYNSRNESNANPPDDPNEATYLMLPAGEIRPVDIALNQPLFVTGISPSSVRSHSDALISLRGEGFLPNSVVNLGLGHEFLGTFNAVYQNPNELQLFLPPEAKVGKLTLEVVRPPGGEGNASYEPAILEVTPAPMAVSSIVPGRAAYNSNELITIRGTNFYPNMWVRLKHATAGYEVEESATFISATEATFRVSAAAPASRYALRAVRYPGNIAENYSPEVPFEIVDNPLRINEITPAEVYASSGALVTLRGTGFTNHSIIRLSSVSNSASYQVTPASAVSSTEITFPLPGMLTPDRYSVTVIRPPGDSANVSNAAGLVVLVPPTTTTTTTTTTTSTTSTTTTTTLPPTTTTLPDTTTTILPPTTTTLPDTTTTILPPTTTTLPPTTTTLPPTTTTLPPTTTTLPPTTTTLPPTTTTTLTPTTTLPPTTSTTTTSTTTTTIFNPPPFGTIESPRQGSTVQGIIPVIGWGLDDNGQVRVSLLVNGVPSGSQVATLPRPDVADVFPQYPNSANSGFRFELDTRNLPDRFHQITVVFQDRLGSTSSPQTILIYVLNNP